MIYFNDYDTFEQHKKTTLLGVLALNAPIAVILAISNYKITSNEMVQSHLSYALAQREVGLHLRPYGMRASGVGAFECGKESNWFVKI